MADEKQIDWNLEKIVGTKAKVKVLRELARVYPHDLPASELSRQTKLSKRPIEYTLTDLTEIGVLKYRTVGCRKLYSLVNDAVYNTLINVEKSLEDVQKTQLAIQAS